MPLNIWWVILNFFLPLLYACHLQISKMKPFLIDSPSEECSKHVFRMLVNLNSNFLIKKGTYIKKVYSIYEIFT